MPLNASFSFQIEMATGWLAVAKDTASLGTARYAMECGMRSMRKALAAANRSGDNAGKRLAMGALNRMRAQFRSLAA